MTATTAATETAITAEMTATAETAITAEMTATAITAEMTAAIEAAMLQMNVIRQTAMGIAAA